jgi:predicted RNA-binding protein (virulence factor B family)
VIHAGTAGSAIRGNGSIREFYQTIQGTVQKVKGNIYYIQTDQGEEVRLRLDHRHNKEGEIKEGDTIEALVTQEKEFRVISAHASQE